MGDAALRSPATADSAGQEAHTASEAEEREHPGQCPKSRRSERLREPQTRPGPACSQLPTSSSQRTRGPVSAAWRDAGTSHHHIQPHCLLCWGHHGRVLACATRCAPPPRSWCLRSWIVHPPFTESSLYQARFWVLVSDQNGQRPAVTYMEIQATLLEELLSNPAVL